MNEAPDAPEELTDSVRATRFRVSRVCSFVYIRAALCFQNLTSINASDEDLSRIVTTSDQESLLASVRKRIVTPKEQIETGSLNVLSAKYEVRIIPAGPRCQLFFVESRL